MSSIESKAEALEPSWVGEVLRFWFEELTESNWFQKSEDLDALIRNRFLALREQLAADDGPGAATPRAILATVIVLDQFSRNLFRGDPRAFAADTVARRISRFAIEKGFDSAMTRHERMFLYLPFEHSEDAGDQMLALELIGRLGSEDLTRYSLAHKEIIDRFGRFPHRNDALGRHSTAEELEFLRDPKSSF